MTYTTAVIPEFLSTVAPFDCLSERSIHALTRQLDCLRYRPGQAISVPDRLPSHIRIVYEGQVQLLGLDKAGPMPLKLLQPGEVFGWLSHIRQVPCELAIAAVESVCLQLPAPQFLVLLENEPEFAQAFYQQCSVVEVFELLKQDLDRRAIADRNFEQRLQQAILQAQVMTLKPGQATRLDFNQAWFLSAGALGRWQVGDCIPTATSQQAGKAGARLLGIPTRIFDDLPKPAIAIAASKTDSIPYAAELAPLEPPSGKNYPIVSGRGPKNSTIACFQMVCQVFEVPFRRDVVHQMVERAIQANHALSLEFCVGLAEAIGFSTQLIPIPVNALPNVPVPAMIIWQNSPAVLYKASDRELVLGVPDQGLLRLSPQSFAQTWGEQGAVLLLKTNEITPQKRFGLRWFVPALLKHRRVFIEVLLASIVVQLIGLVNPIVTQVIIDKVLNQGSLNALSVLGVLVLVVSVIEGFLSTIRTQLFADTTNRIDLALSAKVIDHLLRLPLRFFEKHPVGDLAGRLQQLETIRQFMTGTVLHVVLDALFSVIYIAVMVYYSPVLTTASLAIIPVFALLTLTVAPLMRRQFQEKTDHYLSANAYLVETLSGIQTIKAQNLEMRSRWQWQDRYVGYIGAAFKTVATQTTAESISKFLNQLSTLLVLWIGAYLVIQNSLTLGQVIAFRMIAGYVTEPLLRLIQLWQNFQETSFSLQVIGEVLDTPQEQEPTQATQILMPTISGAVRFENVSFAFHEGTPPQLSHIHLTISPGTFVGIAGQSGSGKSTLMKLLARLYEPQVGKVVVDDYDISKVELYSLRQQIGMVLQEAVLFDGTIRDNIAMANPDATEEQVIEAAKIAYAHDFIMSLPNGYSTKIGERGVGLSGGQRQRIAIARVILQHPKLLILDEATSALDYQAENHVCRNLANQFSDHTVFFITHRLSTLRHADVILMMEQGAIVETGTHEELMARQGYYYNLYQQQNSKI
jgi:ATP-binding cassette, subfamily B, bacterial HlyB/CyaB